MRLALVVVSSLFVFACGGGGGDDAVDSGGGGGADGAAGADAGGGGGEACPVTGYAPCVGDVVGTWSIGGFCPDDPAAAAALFEHPYSDTTECADRELNTVDGVLVHEGTITFTATEAQANFTEEAHVTWGFTTACLGAVFAKSTAEDACAELGSGGGNLTCTFAADYCTCAGVIEGKPSTETIAYTVDGSAMQLGEAAVTYCVDGDTLTLDFAEHPVSWRYWVLDRQP